MITVILNDTSKNDHYGSRLVMSQIHANCERVGIRIQHSVPIGEDWRLPKHIEHVNRADCVIVNGEGSMHGSRKNAFRLALAAEYCRQRSTKCFLINSVYEKNSEEIASLVSCYDRIYVRESRSQRSLANQGIKAEIVPDMTLSYWPQTMRSEARRVGILLSDSASRESSKWLYERYKELGDAEAISLRVRQRGGVTALGDLALIGTIKLLRTHAPKKWRQKANAVAKAAAQQFTGGIKGSLDQLLDRIAGSDLLITGRFHMVCLALITRTPFIAIPSNTHKIEGLLEDIGLAQRLMPERASPKETRALCHWQRNELEKVEAYLAKARYSIAVMFNSLRTELG